MSVKALGTSLKLTFEGKNQLIYAETWFFVLVVAICVVMQMNYLNKVCYLIRFIMCIPNQLGFANTITIFQALDTFNTAIVSPIYYVMFTTLTILASVIMFKVASKSFRNLRRMHKMLLQMSTNCAKT